MLKVKDIPLLFAQAGPLAGSRWNLDGNLLIGRDVGCDIHIDDRQISRRHATLTY